MAKQTIVQTIKGPVTKKILCNCTHEIQDTMYGVNFRLHNKCVKGYRCVVCCKLKS